MLEESSLVFGNFADSGLNDYLLTNYTESTKVILMDEYVYEIWGESILTSISAFNRAEIILIPRGEENKTLETCAQVWGALLEYNIGRSDIIINIGGGVTTDLGGFIASTYKRGIDFINVPTTLMAQVDASTGGKTGVDFEQYKNVIGSFTLPNRVYIDSNFLSTLDEKEVLSGLAEMLKHGLIADQKLWNELATNKVERKKIGLLVERSVRIKERVVKQDFKEIGLRKTLNFGHTVGHAIESYFLKIGKSVTHGECVAWGMMIEAKLSQQIKNLEKSSTNSIIKVLFGLYGFPKKEDLVMENLSGFLKNDKKNSGKNLLFVLLTEIGKAEWDVPVDESEITSAIDAVYSTVG